MSTDTPADVTVRRSPSIGKLAAAMVKAQAELRNPPKDAVNPHFKSRYADLATVRDCVLPVFNRHGLAVLQLPCDVGGDAALTTLLTHDSGEWVETTMRTRPVKADPQALGSALTYARRYSLQAVAGVAADDDDDGQAASRPAPAAARVTKPAPDHTPGVAEPDPLNRKADMDALLAAKGKTWAAALKWLSSQPDVSGKYADPGQWENIPEADRRKLVAAMSAKPGK